MTRVNVDSIAFTDGRFKRLADLLGLADADHARSKVEYVWLACTIRGELELPRWVVEQHLGPSGPEALVECELARWSGGRGDSKTRRMYICGTRGRTEWFTRLQGQSSKGGKARAEKTSRQAGKFTSHQAGAETSPLTLALAPALAPALTEISEEDSARASHGGLDLLKAKVDAYSGDVGKRRSRKPKPADFAPDELAAATRVLERLTSYNQIAYRSNEHTRLVVARLRDGVTEAELRAVVAYCANDLGWATTERERMLRYLQPSTLFGPRSIAKYLDPARAEYADDIAKLQPVEPRLALVPEAG